MAHFAKLDEHNTVIEVLAVNNAELLDNGVESEHRGIQFLVQWSGGYTNWKQTSYNGNMRMRFAGIGYTYSDKYDAFIPAKPYPSWVFDEQTLDWTAPTMMPVHGLYKWDEDTKSWQPDMAVNVEVFE